MAETNAAVALSVRALKRSDWPAVERLFGPNGACGGCWCMWWRVERGGDAWAECKGEPNRRRLKRLVESGAIHAIIAFADGEPVGWCNFGPRRDFPRLDRSRVLQRAGAAARWSIACFFVRSRWRKRGIGRLLLEHAVTAAFRRKADEVEGYPKTVRAAGGRAPAAFVWTGVPAMFEASGFTPVRAEGSERFIYVKRRGVE